MSKKLEMLARHHKGKVMMRDFVATTAAALGRLPDHLRLVPLEETDEVFERFQAAWKAARADRASKLVRRHEARDLETLMGFVQNLRPRFLPAQLFLFRAKSRWCGAIRESSSLILARIPYLLEVDQEDVLACGESGTPGVVVESYTEQPSSEVRYRLLWYDVPKLTDSQ